MKTIYLTRNATHVYDLADFNDYRYISMGFLRKFVSLIYLYILFVCYTNKKICKYAPNIN